MITNRNTEKTLLHLPIISILPSVRKNIPSERSSFLFFSKAGSGTKFPWPYAIWVSGRKKHSREVPGKKQMVWRYASTRWPDLLFLLIPSLLWFQIHTILLVFIPTHLLSMEPSWSPKSPADLEDCQQLCTFWIWAWLWPCFFHLPLPQAENQMSGPFLFPK